MLTSLAYDMGNRASMIWTREYLFKNIAILNFLKKISFMVCVLYFTHKHIDH